MTELEIDDSTRKKRYLKRYKKNIESINRLKNKVANLNERMLNIKSPGFSDMPRGGTPITKEDLIIEKEEILERIKRLENKGKKLKVEILEKIDELDDIRYVEILESFFIECKSFETIANDTGYTLRHVIRLYSDAINIMSF